MAEHKQIDYSYYYSLFDFDSKYYKLYDKYMYDNENAILDLYNGNISPDKFVLEEKKYEYQILGDYYKYFNDDLTKASEYYSKAINAGNTVCRIKDIITQYKKGTDGYYKALFEILPYDIGACEYIANLLTCCESEKLVNKYIKQIEEYIKTTKPTTDEGAGYYYFLKSSYEFYEGDYNAYISTVKQGVLVGKEIILCNFISNYYNTNKELVWKYINLYLDNDKKLVDSNVGNNHLLSSKEIKRSILCINLFIILKIEENYDEAIKYLIKAINGFNKNEHIDITAIINNTEYNSLLDILFDNFHLVKLNTTYLEIIDFRLLNLLVNYYYKLDPVLYKYNYDFVQFYRAKLLDINNYLINLSVESDNVYSSNSELTFKFSPELVNIRENDIRYKEITVIDYLANLFNNEDYDFCKLMREVASIILDMISTDERECMICFEEYDCLIKTKCRHLLCLKCLSSVLNISPSGETCPYCRQSIFV